ncbi:MAG: hypothetical protein ACOYMN_22870 [Roseimicrobium sp.]
MKLSFWVLAVLVGLLLTLSSCVSVSLFGGGDSSSSSSGTWDW